MNAFVDGDDLVIVSRDGEGVSMRRSRAQNACFLRREEVPPEVVRELRVSRHVVSLSNEGDWIRVVWRDRKTALAVAAKDGWFARLGIEPFEADVDPVRRYLTDARAEVARPRRCFIDIEADSRMTGVDILAARMLAWAIVDEEGNVAASAVLEEDTDEAEHELITAIWAALGSFDQVIAWAGVFFDFRYLLARTERRGIDVETRRWLWLDQLRLYQKMNMNAAESGDEKQSLKLNDVARAVAGVEKLDGMKGSESWEEWCRDPARLLAYCEHDTRLCFLIEQKTGYVELLLTLCQSTYTFPDTEGLNPTKQVEGFLLRLGIERGMHFPTYHYTAKEQFEGAFVMEPTEKGIVRDVHVCDFARLYPSVILSFNLSLETALGRQQSERRPSYVAHERRAVEIPEGCAVVPRTRVVVAQEPRGVLPIALEEMLRLRKDWDKKKAALPPGTPEWKDADRRSAAYKIAANSFYGVVGSPHSRFFVRDVAESTSQGGVWLIKETIAAAEARGFKVIYGDTDSAFVTGCTDAEFAEFVAWCNAELYPRLLRERGATRNTVSLAYEKKFKKAVFISKKRYAASFAHYKGAAATRESKLEVKGLEYKRGDTTRLARALQLEVVELLLREEVDDPSRFEALLDERKERILKGELELSDIVLSKRLAKPVREYRRTKKADGEYAQQPPHVEVARVLMERGEVVRKGDRIDYVVVDGGAGTIDAIPAVDFTGAFDRFYLWDSLVYPPTQRVLEAAFPDHDWTTWERTRPPRPRIKTVKEDPRQLKLWD